MAKEENIIEINNLTKIFHIPHEERSTLAESIIGAISKGKIKYEKLYALRDISLAVKKGDFLGIIGPNGSGKTTLLKVIASILQPDKGSILVKGKVVSFLELGIGFVQELTAKENIYLYSSLLGLARKDTDEKLDAIISFAGIKKFIDTPLKDFSTGMMARLAFSIAKNVEADIYLIDEVLAVGDEKFQKKCIKVFEELKKKDKTVVFVSHNPDLVNKICDEVAWLENGALVRKTKVDAVIKQDDKQASLRKKEETEVSILRERIEQEKERLEKEKKELEQEKLEIEKIKKHVVTKKGRRGTKEIELASVKCYNRSGKKSWAFRTGEPIKIVLCYNAKKKINKPMFGIGFYDDNGRYISGPNTIYSDLRIPYVEGKGKVIYEVKSLPLLQGNYYFSAAIHDQSETKCYDWHDKLYTIKIVNGKTNERYGLIQIPCRWTHKK
jgi:lipopolysaccharide transport system ATP-binding protein